MVGRDGEEVNNFASPHRAPSIPITFPSQTQPAAPPPPHLWCSVRVMVSQPVPCVECNQGVLTEGSDCRLGVHQGVEVTRNRTL